MKILIKSSGMGWVGVKKVRKSCDVIYACSYDKSVILHLKVAKFQEMPFLLPYVHKWNMKLVETFCFLVVKLFNMTHRVFEVGPFTIIELRTLKGSFSTLLTFI